MKNNKINSKKLSGSSLLQSWLIIKLTIICALFFMIGFNYIFGADQGFWYELKMDFNSVKRAANNISDIDKFDKDGLTALMRAANAGRDDVVSLLISKGSNVNIQSKDQYGDTALHYACWDSVQNYEVIKVLLKNKANPVLVDKKGFVPLNYILETSTPENFKRALDLFIELGVDVNYPDAIGRTLLFYAVDKMQMDILKFMQEEYASLWDYNVKDKNGQTVYQFGLGKGDISGMIKPTKMPVLNPTVDVNSYMPRYSISGKDDKFTPTIVAALKGDVDYLKEAINKYRANLNLKDKIFGGSTLHWALLYNRLASIEVLIKKGTGTNLNGESDSGSSVAIDTNLKSLTGLAPIHCLWGIRKNEDRLKAAKLLFDFGSDFNQKDNDGNTFLHNAVLWADKDYVKLLTSDEYFYRRINFNEKNNAGKTAFDLVKIFKDRDSKYKDIYEFLSPYLSANHLGSKDRDAGITPLMLAAMRGDEQSAKSLLDSSKKAVEDKSKDGDTPLHFAIRFRNIGVSAMLIKAGANTSEKNKLGNMPMHEIANIFNKEKREAAVKLLLENGAAIGENNNGETIMHMAVRKKMPDLILFLKKNFGKMEKNKEGKTAYDLAKELGNKGENMKAVLDALDGKAQANK